MHKARKDDRGNMCDHNSNGDVGKNFVNLLYHLAGRFADYPGQRPSLVLPAVDHQPAHNGSDQQR